MTRIVLCASLAALALALGLVTALVQSGNRERGLALNALKEECGMIEAINGERAEEILSRDFGPLPYEPRPAATPQRAGATGATGPAVLAAAARKPGAPKRKEASP